VEFIVEVPVLRVHCSHPTQFDAIGVGFYNCGTILPVTLFVAEPFLSFQCPIREMFDLLLVLGCEDNSTVGGVPFLLLECPVGMIGDARGTGVPMEATVLMPFLGPDRAIRPVCYRGRSTFPV